MVSKTSTATLVSALKRSRPDVYEKLKIIAERQGVKISDLITEMAEKYIVYGETYPAWVGLINIVDEIDWSNLNPDAMKASIFIQALAYHQIAVQAKTIGELMGTYVSLWKDVVTPLLEVVKELATKEVAPPPTPAPEVTPPTPTVTVTPTTRTSELAENLRFWLISEIMRIMNALPGVLKEITEKFTRGRTPSKFSELLPRPPKIEFTPGYGAPAVVPSNVKLKKRG